MLVPVLSHMNCVFRLHRESRNQGFIQSEANCVFIQLIILTCCWCEPVPTLCLMFNPKDQIEWSREDPSDSDDLHFVDFKNILFYNFKHFWSIIVAIVTECVGLMLFQDGIFKNVELKKSSKEFPRFDWCHCWCLFLLNKKNKVCSKVSIGMLECYVVFVYLSHPELLQKDHLETVDRGRIHLFKC